MQSGQSRFAVLAAQLAGAIAATYALCGADARPAWLLSAAAIPCALEAVARLARAARERRAFSDESLPGKSLPGKSLNCDIAPDPLAPDWGAVADGVAAAMSRSISESRPVRLRLFPCGSTPYAVTILPPKRGSDRPRLSVAPVAAATSCDAAAGERANAGGGATREIAHASVRIPLPIEVSDAMETAWVSPCGGRARIDSEPRAAVLPLPFEYWFVVAAVGALAATGHFRAALLALACAAIRAVAGMRPAASVHVAWIAGLLIARAVLLDAAPVFFGDPLRLLIYAYILPAAAIAAWRRCRRERSHAASVRRPAKSREAAR